jgi:hypothetical protein
MEERKSGRPPAPRPGHDVAEKLARDESRFETAERRLGEELYDNSARFADAVESGRAERDAFVDRTKERTADTARRIADELKGDADAASRE